MADSIIPTTGASVVAPIATTAPITPIPTTGTGASSIVEPSQIAPPPKHNRRYSAPLPQPVIIAPPYYPYPQYINGIPALQTLYDGIVAIPNTLLPNMLITENNANNGANEDVIKTQELDQNKPKYDTKKIIVLAVVIASAVFLLIRKK